MSDLVKVFALGGLDEAGRDCYVVEINDDIFVLDCGTSLPDKTIPGVDYIIPNPSYLIKNRARIKGYFISHGHDESMAGLKYFYNSAPAPVYCSDMTYKILMGQSFMRNIFTKPNVVIVKPTETIKVAGREVRFFQTVHNTPESSGIAIYTDQGYVVYTSDFIIDFTAHNKGYYFDLPALEDLAKNPILLLMSESKTANRSGYCSPKHRAAKLIEKYFRDNDQRIFITCFVQNTYRIEEILTLCKKYNKKIYVHGEVNPKIKEYLVSVSQSIPDLIKGVNFINKEDILRVREKDLVVLLVGLDEDLYEEIDALASGQSIDKRLSLLPTDIFINAGLPRPTLEVMCTRAMDKVYRTGCEVLWLKKNTLTSMHAREDDLKFFLSVLKPKHYLPVRGSFVNMMANAKIALSMDIGLNHMNVFILDNGMQLVFDGKTRPQLIPQEASGIMVDPILIDGTGISHLGSKVISDRLMLSQDGVVVIAAAINPKEKEIVAGPDCQMRGFVYVKEAEPLLKSLTNIFVDEIKTAFEAGAFDAEKVKENISERAKRFVKRENGREPYIMPIIDIIE